eukprot:UN01832
MLFSHPADFTPVCATELATANEYMPQFSKRNCKLLAYSCDTKEKHTKWVADIEKLSKDKGTKDAKMGFPILAGEDRKVAVTYGMLDPKDLDAKGLPLTT